MSDIAKIAISKDGSFIIITMQGMHKEIIIDCLSAIENDIQSSHPTIAETLIAIKK